MPNDSATGVKFVETESMGVFRAWGMEKMSYCLMNGDRLLVWENKVLGINGSDSCMRQ